MDRAESNPIELIRADFNDPVHRDTVLDSTSDDFEWMNLESQQATGCSIPELVGMDLEPYIAFIRGRAAGMGGLRRLPDGSAEVVRIYVSPEHRGLGIGKMLLQQLIGEARRLGSRELKLDTGVFMKAAQSIYRAAGFVEIEPYEGAEPPEAMHSIWLSMQKTL